MKNWFLERFLPMWAKQTVLADNRRLQQKIRLLEQKVQLQESYLEGLQLGLRTQKKVNIYNRGGKE